MQRKLSLLFTVLVSVSLLLTLVGSGAAFAQDVQSTLSPVPSEPPPVPDDIMPSHRVDAVPGSGTTELDAASYSVLPILFVPSDLTPNPYGLRYINQRMQLVQRWYAEQLRGRTFTLQPAIIVRGSHPLRPYYGDCNPPDNCDSFKLWTNIFTDLTARGYPYQSNLIRGVFFQHDGLGGPALGGGGDFLVALDPDNTNGDCLEPGCAASVAKGGAAHELGHAFGLDHTVDDPEESPGVSVMSYGFYNFPQATLVNTALNPERDMLYASPFLNIQMSLTNGGFEDCLASWSVISGAANCSSSTKRSGLKALTLSPTSGNNVQVRQQISASQRTYDISAWINSPDAGNHHIWIQIAALNANAQVLSSQIFGDLSGATDGWRQIAYSFTAPAQTIALQVRILASGSSPTTIYVDDLEIHESKLIPPIPLQMFYLDGDTVNGNLPTLQWDDVTSAISYQIQVSANNSFTSPIWDVTVTSPFFQVPSGLSLNARYFWRVRARNGSGASDWSSIRSFVTAGPQDYFSDEFETMELDTSWSWIREDQVNWYLGGPLGRRWTGYLGITAQAGDLLGSDNSAKNLLLKDPPQGNYDITTKIELGDLSLNYQQAGLLIYQDDNNYLKLVRTYNNGNKLQWLVEVNGVIVQDTTIPIWVAPPIRITRSGNQYTAKYSVDSITWKTLGSPATVGWSNPKIGLAAFSKLNVQQISAYFDYFRVNADVTTQVTITGSASAAGVTLGYTDTAPKTALSQPNGGYSLIVPRNWSGMITPTHSCFTFSPANRSYSNLAGNQTTQNYTATVKPGCADLTISIGAINRGRFGLSSSGSTRASFASVNSGPVKLITVNAVPVIGAERVIYKVNGVNTSFTETMGLPQSQLDTTYWLPWYNNVGLDTQLRIANVSNSQATVTVTIGGVSKPSFNLAAGASTRVSYAGVDSGPVKIVSTQNIVAAERVIYKVNKVQTSFSEMMALPNKQLSNTYYLPWYDNVNLDTQLRIANVTNQPATVTVTIGGQTMPSFNLAAGASTRVSYAGKNNGPVKIVSNQTIAAAERVIYKFNGIPTSFTEMMALPNSQLQTTNWLPWYNNVGLNTQLRISNVSNATATVRVYIAGQEMTGSPFNLPAGTGVSKSYAGIDKGPVKIVSTQNIVVSEPLIYKVNGTNVSFSEMMGLPNTLLDTTYWLPWYNNVDLDTQLRFGVP